MTEHRYIECLCESSEHTLRVNFDPTDEFLPLWLDIHLVQYRTWYQRLWTAIRYVFGYRSKYGDFDTCILSREQTGRLVTFLDQAYPAEQDIESRIQTLSERSKAIEQEVAELRARCPHPEFVEGLSLMGCIQPILICKVCGEGKPINENGNPGSYAIG